jgi:hypothetical protein
MGTKPQAPTAIETPQLFLLRVWLERGDFRAALREIGGAEPQVFTRPVEVGEYLSQSLSSPRTDLDSGGK